MTLVVHTARASAMPLDDALHVSIPGNEAFGDRLGHRGIGFAFCPRRQLRDQYRARVAAGIDSDRYWLNCCDYYLVCMRESYKRNFAAWRELLSWPRVVLIGEEAEARRCFSGVLAERVLRAFGAKYAGEIG